MNWRSFFRKYIRIISINELFALSGQVAYYIILSFFPFVIFLLTLVGFLNISNAEFFGSFKFLLPTETFQMVETIVNEVFSVRSSPALLVLSMIGALWASLNGINALMRGAGKAYGLQETWSFFRLKLSALLFFVIVALAIVGSFLVLIFGQKLTIFFVYLLGPDNIFPLIWQNLRLLIQFIFLIMIFILLNIIATHNKYPIRSYFTGSLFSAGGWIIISLAFAYYVNHFNSYTLAYGSIAGIILLLLWLYWSCVILLLGSALNATFIDRAN
jgi:membrane protein